MTAVDDTPAVAADERDALLRLPAPETVEFPGKHRTRSRGWLVRRALLAADMVGLLLAFVITELTAVGSLHVGRMGGLGGAAAFLSALPLFVVIAKLYGLYDRDEERTDHSTVDEFMGVFHLVTVGTWAVVAIAWLVADAKPDVPKLILFWALAVALIVASRGVARVACRHHASYVQNAVVVGAGDVGQLVARKIRQHPEYGINVVGFVDGNPRELRPGLEQVPVLGPLDSLPEVIRRFDIARVIVAFSEDSHEETVRLLRSVGSFEVQVDIVPRLFEIVGTGVDFHMVEGLPLVGLRPPRLPRSSRLIKRTMDIVVAGTGVLVLAPLLALAGLAIKLDSPGPVLFRQVRRGRAGQLFRIYKFRTMVVDAEARKAELAALNKHARPGGDARMFKVENDPRTTRVGRFLRRYSIDELPQLLNVVFGDMSLVGPRPLVLDEDRFVEDWARRRLDLRPGITGLWQVLGRSDIPFNEMVRLDYLYVTSWSLGTDLRLLAKTIPVVLRVSRREC